MVHNMEEGFQCDIFIMMSIIFVSLVFFAFSMTAFVMIGHSTIRNNSFLVGVLAVVGIWCFLNGLSMVMAAVRTCRDIRKTRKVLKRKGAAKRVRFSSPVEIHEDFKQSIDVENNSLLDEYGETDTESTEEVKKEASSENSGNEFSV